ncbi:MAG TPA: hypothetical protein VFQ73_02115 [Flavisolibacter sp.]|nr:hypothetical protein [Flavisolibacter sp.]
MNQIIHHLQTEGTAHLNAFEAIQKIHQWLKQQSPQTSISKLDLLRQCLKEMSDGEYKKGRLVS